MPEDTARIAQAAFRRGNPYVLLRERIGAVFADADFADPYPQLGQPAYAPWRLALVTLLQFREGRSDQQAAEAVRARNDLKYPLLLDLADAGEPVPVKVAVDVKLGGWLRGLLARAHMNTAVVALAAKLARTAWVVIRSGQRFDMEAATASQLKGSARSR